MNIPKRLPKRDSAIGRALATVVQFWGALVVSLPAIVGLLSDPQLRALVEQYAPKLIPTLSFAIFLATWLSNYVRKDVKNY